MLIFGVLFPLDFHSARIDKTRRFCYNSNMRVLYFDTETTGLRPEGSWHDGILSPGQICQLAYLVWEDGVVRPFDHYFEVGYIEPSATAVTGLTVEIVRDLAQGKVFCDYAESIAADFAAADVVVAHNLYFDESFMRAEMARLGMRFFLGDKGFCSMRSMTEVLRLPGRHGPYKWPSLAELAAYYGVTDQDVADNMHELFGTEKAAHDARHDTVKMYLALSRAAQSVPFVAHRLGYDME